MQTAPAAERRRTAQRSAPEGELAPIAARADDERVGAIQRNQPHLWEVEREAQERERDPSAAGQGGGEGQRTHDALRLLAGDKLDDDADIAVGVLDRVFLHDEPLELACLVAELLLLLGARALCGSDEGDGEGQHGRVDIRFRAAAWAGEQMTAQERGQAGHEARENEHVGKAGEAADEAGGRWRTVLIELDDPQRDDLVTVLDEVLHRPVEGLGSALVGRDGDQEHAGLARADVVLGLG